VTHVHEQRLIVNPESLSHACMWKFTAGENFTHECMHVLQENDAVVYNTIHGGLGEDGSLQQYLSQYDIPYTGSPEVASRICMDKLATATFIGVRSQLWQ
jgi:D-alanine-D-alanine ligase-like ATP-grasp enzyme